MVRNFTGAYPRPYRAFGNLDFGTVKGFTVGYDMRRAGSVRLNANYTLQFADRTGSTTSTALALINRVYLTLERLTLLTTTSVTELLQTSITDTVLATNDGPVANFGGKSVNYLQTWV